MSMVATVPAEYLEEAKAITKDDPGFAAILRSVDLTGFQSAGRRVYGTSGFCLIGDIRLNGLRNKHHQTRPVTVELGDGFRLIAAAAGFGEAIPGNGGSSLTGTFRGRRVTVFFLQGIKPFMKLRSNDLVTVKVFHNPVSGGNEEHHFFQFGRAQSPVAGQLILDQEEHPTRDLVVEPIILVNGGPVRR